MESQKTEDIATAPETVDPVKDTDQILKKLVRIVRIRGRNSIIGKQADDINRRRRIMVLPTILQQMPGQLEELTVTVPVMGDGQQ